MIETITEGTRVILCPIPGSLRITVIADAAKDALSVDKLMTASQMRILAIRLLQTAEEMERGVGFVKS